MFERKVSLTANKMPLNEALEAVVRQANVGLELDEPALAETDLDLDAKISAQFEHLPLSDALGELIEWQAHPGVFREFRSGKVFLSTLPARNKRIRAHLPKWLSPFQNKGMVANLDENNDVVELTFGQVLTDDLLEKLKTLPSLRKLTIGPTDQLTRAGIGHLGKLPARRTLDVHGIDDWGDDILKSISVLESLRELAISECGTTDAGVKRLEQMPQLTQLRFYQEGRLTDAAISSIAKLENLKSLRLTSRVATQKYGWMRFGPEALRQLSALRQLEVLQLTGHEFPADAFAFPKLKALSISGQQVDDEFTHQLHKVYG